MTSAEASHVAGAIIRWFGASARTLPWRTTPRDPYRSLVSEFMLQQTQAGRIAERFDSFVTRFPSIGALAEAELADVLSEWSGLGYYQRARNLHACARQIRDSHAGRVPDDPDSLRELPGIGAYTAGAIASMVYGRPAPTVDGNVARVLIRVHGLDLEHGSSEALREATDRSGTLMRAVAPGSDVAALAEGLIELGATICTPRTPKCPDCPIHDRCVAYDTGRQEDIPRSKRPPRRSELFCVSVVVMDGTGRVLLEPRPETGLWAGLWQAPTWERAERPWRTTEIAVIPDEPATSPVCQFTHMTTHRTVRFQVIRLDDSRAGQSFARARPGARWLHPDQAASAGISSAQRRVLTEAGVIRD